jgi:hypothetical protein
MQVQDNSNTPLRLEAFTFSQATIDANSNANSTGMLTANV